MRKMKKLGKLSKILLLSLTIVFAAVVSPHIVNSISANGFDPSVIIDILMGRVENQEEKIKKLESEIVDLKEKLENDEVKEDVIKEPKVDEKPEVLPEEPKPEEPKPTEPKPVAPKPVAPKPTEPKPIVKPTPEVTKPEVTVYMKDTSFKLLWTKEESKQLKGYKVVFSSSNAAPSYPNDGYLTWITDKHSNYVYVDNSIKYNGGDIDGLLKPNTQYFVAVTYVYEDKSVTTPAVKVTTPASFNTGESLPLPPSSLSVTAKLNEDSFKLIWTKEPSDQLVEYKVVISQFNPSPSFPSDGYLVCIEENHLHYTYVDNKTQYTGGDFYGYLLADTEYYIAITYVYKGTSVTTKAIKVKTPVNLYVPTR
jgi:cell division protein FtsL